MNNNQFDPGQAPKSQHKTMKFKKIDLIRIKYIYKIITQKIRKNIPL